MRHQNSTPGSDHRHKSTGGFPRDLIVYEHPVADNICTDLWPPTMLEGGAVKINSHIFHYKHRIVFQSGGVLFNLHWCTQAWQPLTQACFSTRDRLEDVTICFLHG